MTCTTSKIAGQNGCADAYEAPIMNRFLRDHGLIIVMFGLFARFLVGQSFTGFRTYNQGQRAHSEPTVNNPECLTSDHIIEATFYNWEGKYR